MIEPCFKYQNLSFWMKKIQKDCMVIGIAQQIIKKGISNQIAFNIMDLKDFKKMWNKLKSIYIQIGQEIIY